MSDFKIALTNEEADAMRRGNKLQAIKLTRYRLHLGLLEAKHFVERWDGATITAGKDLTTEVFFAAQHKIADELVKAYRTLKDIVNAADADDPYTAAELKGFALDAVNSAYDALEGVGIDPEKKDE